MIVEFQYNGAQGKFDSLTRRITVRGNTIPYDNASLPLQTAAMSALTKVQRVKAREQFTPIDYLGS